eukprot:6156-Heterococcus_DN1.PRE.10
MMIPSYAPATSESDRGPFILPEGTIVFQTGSLFNKPLVLPSTLRTMVFGEEFNQPVKLNKGIQSVSFGDAFDHPLDVPASCSVVNVGKEYPHKIKGLIDEPGNNAASNRLGPHKSVPVSFYGDNIQEKVGKRDVRGIGADSMSAQQTDNLVKEQHQSRA